jgi:competence protein ComEA
VDREPRSTIVIWAVAAVLAVFAGIRLFGGGDPGPPAVSIGGAGGGEAGVRDAARGRGAARSAGSARGAELYVHVAGAVRRPGLIRVPPETRVASALDRAGGPTRRADLTLVNLAAKVQDGQQIVVPVKGAGGVAGAVGAGGAAATPGAQIHLSTATAEQLDEVDGIGPTLAERIVEYRDAHGGFASNDQLAQVDGIGEKRLATLRDALQP